MPKRLLRQAGLLAGALLASSAGAAAQDGEPPQWLRGRLGLRYLYRGSTEEESDHDLYQYLSLEGGRASRDPVTASLYARGAWDADGGGLGPTGRSLSSIQDPDGRYELRLNHAWVAFHELLEEGELKVGRQVHFETPVLLTLDGASARTPLSVGGQAFQLSVYGGVPEHFYEASRSGDAAAGLALDFMPWKNGSARFDALHLRDRNLFGDPKNSLVAGRVSHRSGDGRAWVSAYTSFLDWEHRDLSADASWTSSDQDLRVYVFGHLLRSRQSANALEFDPFTSILLDEQPYQEGQAVASYSFDVPEEGGKEVQLDLGVYGRALRDQDRASEFNREYQRYWTTATFEGLPVEKTWLALTAEFFDSGQDQITTGGGEIGVEPAEHTELTLGSYFSLYQFDFFSGEERSRVREYTLRARHRWSDSLRFLASLSYENDEPENFVIASLLVELSF